MRQDCLRRAKRQESESTGWRRWLRLKASQVHGMELNLKRKEQAFERLVCVRTSALWAPRLLGGRTEYGVPVALHGPCIHPGLGL